MRVGNTAGTYVLCKIVTQTIDQKLHPFRRIRQQILRPRKIVRRPPLLAETNAFVIVTVCSLMHFRCGRSGPSRVLLFINNKNGAVYKCEEDTTQNISKQFILFKHSSNNNHMNIIQCDCIHFI